MKNLNTIAEQLFNEIRGRFPDIEIGDSEGNVIDEPQLARFYDFEFESGGQKLGRVSISLDEDSGVVIMFNKNFIEPQYGSTKRDWYGFLKNIRRFAKKRLLGFEVRDLNRTNLKKRLTKSEYKFLAKNRRGEQTMAESRMYGNAKTSFQKIGNAKLSIKHTGAIEEGSNRTRKIGAIYIENTDGERFKYPFKHLSGARALAIHVSEGGHPYDDFGKYITGLSEELSNLRKFKQYMNRSSVMAETLSKHMNVVNERISTVKKEIQKLQKPSYYTQAFEEYVPMEEVEVPEEIANNWIDQLTIKQFNEELKDVFPYIYNLISEATKTKELTLEDIFNEQQGFITYQVQPGDTISSIVSNLNAEGVATTVDQVMADNRNVVDSKGNVKAGTILKINQSQAQAPAQPAPAQPAPAQPVTNGGVNSGLNYSETIDYVMDDLMGQFSDRDVCNECGKQRLTAKEIDELANLEEGKRHGNSKIYDKCWKGCHKVAGKKRGEPGSCKCNEDDQLEKDSKIPVSEFVLSYFDKETGKFPKGPTAVLTMVEKEYGDRYVRPASKFIERINQRVSEITGYKETNLEENTTDIVQPTNLTPRDLHSFNRAVQNWLATRPWTTDISDLNKIVDFYNRASQLTNTPPLLPQILNFIKQHPGRDAQTESQDLDRISKLAGLR